MIIYYTVYCAAMKHDEADFPPGCLTLGRGSRTCSWCGSQPSSSWWRRHHPGPADTPSPDKGDRVASGGGGERKRRERKREGAKHSALPDIVSSGTPRSLFLPKLLEHFSGLPERVVQKSRTHIQSSHRMLKRRRRRKGS